MMTAYTEWLRRLRVLSDHPDLIRNLRWTCLLLGHEPSGEQLMTSPPLDVCYWCAASFRTVKP